MFKRIFALLLCVLMLIPCFAGCSSKKNADDPGAYITMYLTDGVYDFDPANAYYNADTLNVVSMMYDTLFKLDKNGKVKKSLAKDYKYTVDEETGEYSMEITLKEAYWSNNIRLSADDVVFAWKRLLKSADTLSEEQTSTNSTTFNAASLLYDIKNARAVKEGDEPVDRLLVTAEELDVVKIVFEGDIDVDQFLLNLTSVATAPLYENYVTKNPDWAKKPSTIMCSGPFKLGKIIYDPVTGENDKNITETDDFRTDKESSTLLPEAKAFDVRRISYFYLERNIYYYRDTKRDPIDESVTPYRILVNCNMSDADILAAYEAGQLFYISDIPFSLRNNEMVQKEAEVSNALSTFSLYLNQNKEINGKKLFADPNVRKALSMVIDRDAIAKAVVYAEAATGLVPTGVFNGNTYSKKKDFRAVGGALLTTSAASIAEAQGILSAAGINPGSYSFTIKVSAYDEAQLTMAEMIQAAWGETGLGFKVEVDPVYAIVNNDFFKEVEGIPEDVCDDLLIESIQRGNFDVVAFDYTAFSADAYSMLSGFARDFSGMPLNMDATDGNYVQPHVTGYDDADYNAIIEAVYQIPYAATKGVSDAVQAVYTANNITPTTDSDKWADQKATLLHAAETKLMQDLPIIPVVFNKNAVLVHKDLSRVSATYYTPANFQKTKLKGYKDYFYTEDGESISIFADFPVIDWSKKK